MYPAEAKTGDWFKAEDGWRKYDGSHWLKTAGEPGEHSSVLAAPKKRAAKKKAPAKKKA